MLRFFALDVYVLAMIFHADALGLDQNSPNPLYNRSKKEAFEFVLMCNLIVNTRAHTQQKFMPCYSCEAAKDL